MAMQKPAFSLAVTPLPSLILLTFLSVLAQSVSATCTVSETDHSHTLIVEIENKKIAFVGWAHPDEIAIQNRVNQFNKFLTLPNRNCEAIADLVMTAPVDEPEAINSAVSTYRRMMQIPFMDSNVTIGSEISQPELDAKQALDKRGKPKDFFNSANIKSTFEILNRAADQCPDIQPEIANYTLYLLNPEYALWAEALDQKHPIAIRGFDDYDARMRVFRDTSPSDRTFDPAKFELSIATRLILSGLEKRYNQYLEAPSNSAIENAISTVKSSEMSYKVYGYLRAIRLIAQTLPIRNQKIVENIMNTPGNVIMNIGDDHIRGLKSEFEKMCDSEAKQSPAMAPIKVQAKPITKDPAG
jgi:hypothetical protein